MHIVLLGDSVFDNVEYVESGDSVKDLLSVEVSSLYPNTKVTLLAVDGDKTTDVARRLKSFPTDATHVFLSCGGNDALGSIGLLDKSVSSVGEALDLLYQAREDFRAKYIAMLETVLPLNKMLSVCTVYNKIPGMSTRALTALSVFNEVILEETSRRNIPLIDLRTVCEEVTDFSQISPIEPSKNGGLKIVRAILNNISTAVE